MRSNSKQTIASRDNDEIGAHLKPQRSIAEIEQKMVVHEKIDEYSELPKNSSKLVLNKVDTHVSPPKISKVNITFASNSVSGGPKFSDDTTPERVLKERNLNAVYGENIYDSFSGPSPAVAGKGYAQAKNNF